MTAVERTAAKDALAGLVRQQLESRLSSDTAFPQPLRVQTPVERENALGWLRAQTLSPRLYWSDREGDYTVAGVGAADRIAIDKDIDFFGLITRLKTSVSPAHPNLRYYGGGRFSIATVADGPWQTFGACHLVMPRFEVVEQGGQTYFACNILLHSADAVEKEVERIIEELDQVRFPESAADPTTATLKDRVDLPDRDNWDGLVNEALGAIDGKQLDKVVLARETAFTLDGAGNPADVFARLAPRRVHAYAFYLEPEPGTAFMGLSPERLIKREDRFLQSEALAGTCPRGATPEEDDALGDALLASDKNRREHRFVLDTIRDGFQGACHAVHVDESVSLLKVRRCQHLLSRVEGILTDDKWKWDALRTLHPTPAVGGFPNDAALAFIEAREPFDRGWYAGPIGWVGHKTAEFAVGIRSGLLHGDALRLYAGAGIVEGSTAESEWDEIENKMGNFLSALTDDE